MAMNLDAVLKIAAKVTGQGDLGKLGDGLRGLEESPWRDLRGRPLDPSQLARRLRGFHVRSANHRLGTQVVKAYRLTDLADAWNRYLPAIPGNAATPATPPPPLSLGEES